MRSRVGVRVNDKFIERKWPASVGLDRDVTDLDAVDRPFVHIARIVHDLGEWHEFTHMVERRRCRDCSAQRN
jgi:hypothetical protein